MKLAMTRHAPIRAAGVLVALLMCNAALLRAAEPPERLRTLVENNCLDCHEGSSAEGGFDLAALNFNLNDRSHRSSWINVYDRVNAGEMPPGDDALTAGDRNLLLSTLGAAISKADRADVELNGRGPMRRLNRNEFQQNLRDVLQLPQLDIRDMLPEDREGHRFNKTAATLDMSRVQLAGYLDAASAALAQATAHGPKPPPAVKYRATGTQLFPSTSTFGGREAMFFAKDNQAVSGKQLQSLKEDPGLELALFRSAHWPYYGYPRGFVARATGQPIQGAPRSAADTTGAKVRLNYRVRFSARAVLQTKGFRLKPAEKPVAMTFRARKPSGADVSGDVRATGGVIDIQPQPQIFETTIQLLPSETFEYSLLGLPVPLARNVNGGPPTYRYPPFPPGGQPGVAFKWLEVEGPLAPDSWPPASHRVLFDEMGVDVVSKNPGADSRRLLQRFIRICARGPVPETAVRRFEQLIDKRLQQGNSFSEAMLTGYLAFLCSSHFLYLPDPASRPVDAAEKPVGEDAGGHYAIASRLSHFLTETRPDAMLMKLAAAGRLRDKATLRRETDRLIANPGFDRFVKNFTGYWLNLRHIRRDAPDIRLYPEYRFDDYLIESAERETQTFFSNLIRENLPAKQLISADYVYANDRLAQHYGLEPVAGSKLQQVKLPANSPYGGLLTQAAILKVTANGTSTSPVIRGAWIMERLLGQPPPPPPASVPAVEPDIRGAKTIRELLALHTKSESCAGCHARFDPVGLALENFDIVGGWRTRYRAIPAAEPITGIDRAGHDFAYGLSGQVDASGKLLSGRSFRNIHELKAILAEDPRPLARNLLHQFIVYATGTPCRFADREEITSILNACAARGYRVRDLIHGLVQSQIFIGRQGS